jgi:inorganic pyrophosphatase
VIVIAVGLLAFSFAGAYCYATLALTLCACGLVFAKYLFDWLLAKDEGTPEMHRVSNPIREGAGGFLRVQYTVIAKLAVVAALAIFVSYQLRPAGVVGGLNMLSSLTLGTVGAASFAVGCTCSAVAGYVSMLIAAQVNVRVAAAARSGGYSQALAICFRGGAFSSVLVLSLCVSGITLLHSLLHACFAQSSENEGATGLSAADVPMLCVGYGFGASFVALFMQLGGGIYTKVPDHHWRVTLLSDRLIMQGADVGADMVGKVEAGIPEDDPRNPAVIADLVGDMVSF